VFLLITIEYYWGVRKIESCNRYINLQVTNYDSDTDESDRRLSPLPLDYRDGSPDKKSTPPSPSPAQSPHPPSPFDDEHHKGQNNIPDEPSSPRVFPARDSLAKDSVDAGGSGPEDDDYLSYSDSQRKANEELMSMKLDLGYTGN